MFSEVVLKVLASKMLDFVVFFFSLLIDCVEMWNWRWGGFLNLFIYLFYYYWITIIFPFGGLHRNGSCQSSFDWGFIFCVMRVFTDSWVWRDLVNQSIRFLKMVLVGILPLTLSSYYFLNSLCNFRKCFHFVVFC